MRTGLFATIGAVWLAGTGVALAAPISAAAIGEAAEQLNITESVHCRPFRHWHRWGYSRGCNRVYIDEGVRVRTRIGVRDGYRDGYRGGYRGGARSGVTIRSEQRGGFRGGATVRGTQGGMPGTQSGVRGGAQGGMPGTQSGVRGGGQGGMPGTARGTQGGQIKTAPTGGGAGGGLPGTAGSSGIKN